MTAAMLGERQSSYIQASAGNYGCDLPVHMVRTTVSTRAVCDFLKRFY